jgi:Protein of unknown function (DUF2793)
MPQSPRLALPLIAPGQSQKDVTHNEALLALDRMVTLAAVSRSLASPPASPLVGQMYIVPPAGAAAWGQPVGTLMQWQGSGWLAEPPRDGQIALVIDEMVMLVHQGSWQASWPVSGLAIAGRQVLAVPPASVPAATGGSTVDAQARATLAALIQALQQQGLIAN